MPAFTLPLLTLALSFVSLTSCSGDHGPKTTIPPEPTVIVREIAKPCKLPALPERPHSLTGELLDDGRVAVPVATLTALNLWLSAAYERMAADEACH